MAVAAEAQGTQTTVVTTEHFVESTNVAGVFTFHVDLSDMADGDVVELRVYQMVLTGGTARVAYVAAFYGAQPAHDLIKVSLPISNELTDANALRFSILQTFGSSIDAPWKVMRHS